MSCRCNEIELLDGKIKKLKDAKSELYTYGAFASSLKTEITNMTGNLNLAISQEFAAPAVEGLEAIPGKFSDIKATAITKVNNLLIEWVDEMNDLSMEDRQHHEAEEEQKRLQQMNQEAVQP